MIPPVYAQLTADSATSALVSTRVFQGRRPVSAGVQSDLPCITFTVITGFPLIYADSTTGLDFLRTQIDCWAADVDVARQVAEAAKAALVTNGHINYNGDEYDQETRIHRVSFDWLYWHDPT